MVLRLRFDRRAIADLRFIRSYLVQNASPQAAEHVRQHLLARLELIRLHSLAGPPSNIADIRTLAPIRYPYRVYYAVRDDEVVVLHIRHTSRKLPDDLV